MGDAAAITARDMRILSIVQKCTGWLEQVPKRLQTEGIFRVSGSAKVCHVAYDMETQQLFA